MLDTIHHSDGVSLIDGGAILGTVFMTLGVIYGFIWEWGPINWGLMGLVGGFLLGCLIDYLLTKTRHSKERRKGQTAEVIIMVDCREEQVEMVNKTLWGHRALGIATMQ